MCTAVTYKTKDSYFGRTLDHDSTYSGEIVITPRNYPLYFSTKGTLKNHYAMIGIANVEENYPLYYDAVNEKGVAMAGLNDTESSISSKLKNSKDNIAQFEFIPWILSQCATLKEVKVLLDKINIVQLQLLNQLSSMKLHWIISDRKASITVELKEGKLKVYENIPGVLTNNPSFDVQMFSLNNYMHLSPANPKNTFSSKLDLKEYSLGMGTLGLPGGFSSQSRFIRACFIKLNSTSSSSEEESISQLFHILSSVEQPRGCCYQNDNQYILTLYTSCCNLNKGIYYYTTYDNHQITSINMHKENLNSMNLIRYQLIKEEQINYQN